jgi:hypothetical protein
MATAKGKTSAVRSASEPLGVTDLMAKFVELSGRLPEKYQELRLVKRSDGTITMDLLGPSGSKVSISESVDGSSGAALARQERLGPQLRREQAEALRARGFTQAAIASELGVSQKTISNDLRPRARKD